MTEYEPETRIRIESIESTFPIQVTRRVEPLDNDHRLVSADISGQPTGLMRVLAGIGNRMAKKSIESDYDRLVDHFQ